MSGFVGGLIVPEVTEFKRLVGIKESIDPRYCKACILTFIDCLLPN